MKKRETALRYLNMINDLSDVQNQIRYIKDLPENCRNKDYLTTQEFANVYRRGLRVTSYEYCKQMEAYCKGFYLH